MKWRIGQQIKHTPWVAAVGLLVLLAGGTSLAQGMLVLRGLQSKLDIARELRARRAGAGEQVKPPQLVARCWINISKTENPSDELSPHGRRRRNLNAAAARLNGAAVWPGRATGVVADVLLPLRPANGLHSDGFCFAPGKPGVAICLGAGAEDLLQEVAVLARQAGLRAEWIALSANSWRLLPFERELRLLSCDGAVYYFAARQWRDGYDVAVWRQGLSEKVLKLAATQRDVQPLRRPYVTVAAVGDLMPAGVVQTRLLQGGEEALKSVAEVTATADVAIGNLECPLTDARTPTPLKSSRELAARQEFVFKARPQAGRRLVQKLGLDIVSLANNHILDYQSAGLEDTQAHLRAAGVKYSGAGTLSEARRPAIVTRRSVRVAVLSYVAADTLPRASSFAATETRPGPAMIRLDRQGGTKAGRTMIAADIAAAQAVADIVIIGLHWGEEGSAEVRPGQRELAHFCIDRGADMVWGHHPHCLQPVETYKQKLIAYSLGNFVFATPARECLQRTGILIACFDTRGLIAASLVTAAIGHPNSRLTDAPYGLPVLVGDSGGMRTAATR
jgi:hypothetical protein